MKVVIDRLAWLPKSELTVVQIQAIKAALTIQPRKVGDHPGEAPGPIQMWEETDGRIGVPRQYFLDRRKPHHEVIFDVTDGDKKIWAGPLKFVGTLRPDQEKGVATMARALKDDAKLGGILRAACGWGKTVAVLSLATRLEVPTLVIVHKEFLMSQWEERIDQFCPGARVGKVQSDECSIVGKHIALGMMASVANRDYGPVLRDWPGLIIFDETHRVAASTWSVAAKKFPARWRVGVSATPRRKDGAENVFFYHIGPVLYSTGEQRLKAKVKRVWTKFTVIKTPRFNPNLAPKSLILKFLVKNDPRNRIVVNQLVSAVSAGRKVLLLSERLQHLDDLADLFAKTWKEAKGLPIPTTGFYVGGKSEDELEASSGSQVIFATSQYAQEGLDIPALDTLFLTTPLSDVEQAVGRILRPFTGKKEPVVVDFRDDNIPMFARLASSRDKVYQRLT